MAATQLTIFYGTSSAATVPIAANVDYSQAVLNIARGGGTWFTDASGLLTWIPLSQITKVTAS